VTETPRREIRIPDDVWYPAKTQTRAEGVSVSELINNWLEDYLADNAPVHTELNRIIRRLNKINKRLQDGQHNGGFVWPTIGETRNNE